MINRSLPPQPAELPLPPQSRPRTGKLDGNLHLSSSSRLTAQGSTPSRPSTRGAVFLDRDGVMVEDVHYLSSPMQLRILPGVVQALRALQERYFVVVVTNQSGIARGLLTENDLLTIHSELFRRLSAEGAIVDALYYCPHLPEGSITEYRLECDCRKPKPGMLLRAQHEWGIDLDRSFIVGDAPRDIQAGHRVGVKGILLGKAETTLAEATLFAPDLISATRLILA